MCASIYICTMYIHNIYVQTNGDYFYHTYTTSKFQGVQHWHNTINTERNERSQYNISFFDCKMCGQIG